MTPNKPLDPTSVKCDHINWHSMLNGPWAICDDCGVSHVRAVFSQIADGIHIEAGAKSIARALAERNLIQVASVGLRLLHLARDDQNVVTATHEGRPVQLTGLADGT